MGRYKQPHRTKPIFLVIRTKETPGYWLAKELPGEAPGFVRVQWMKAINAAEGRYRLLKQTGTIHENSLLAFEVCLIEDKLNNEYSIDQFTLLELKAYVATAYEN